MNSTLEISQLANIFGTTVDGLGKNCQNFYNNLDMGYEVIEGDEREDLILNILKAIEEDKKVVATPQRTEVWYNGWKENLDDFTANQTINDIIPKFYKPNNIVRLNKQYIKPSDPYFEINYVKLILLYICNRFIGSDIKNVYEFGCGTGFNLITLAEQRKDVNMYGADFVQSSVDLTNEIGNQFNLKIQGSLFNMIEPSYNFQICKDSCAFTFASIEQIANQSANFINYLLHQKPRICFHVEPTLEFYDDNKIIDYIGIKFHKKRNYNSDLFPYLKKLEKENKIKIHDMRTLLCGNKFNEGYNLVVWEPNARL